MEIYDVLPAHVANFQTPDNPVVPSEIGAEARAREARCKHVVRYCALVQQHVYEYDSLDTAASILARAIAACPSIEARMELVKANKLLRAAIKSTEWLASKRKRRHVDASTRNRNLDRFQDAVSESILLLETEARRNASSLIDYISDTYHTDLPLTLADSKRFVVKTVPLVVMLPDNARMDSAVPHMQIESRLYLIKRAHVIGVNTDHVRNREYERTNALVEQRYGCTVYETALRRPSSNVNWYLIQDFRVEIVYAGFVDYLEIDTRNAASETKIRSNRLRDIRLAFEAEHAHLFQQIQTLSTALDNAVDSGRQLAQAFGELTATSDSDPGLRVHPRDYKLLRAHLVAHHEKLLRAGTATLAAARDTFAQRVAARVAYYDALNRMRDATVIRREIKRLRREIEARRYNQAMSLGLVGSRTMMSLDP